MVPPTIRQCGDLAFALGGAGAAGVGRYDRRRRPARAGAALNGRRRAAAPAAPRATLIRRSPCVRLRSRSGRCRSGDGGAEPAHQAPRRSDRRWPSGRAFGFRRYLGCCAGGRCGSSGLSRPRGRRRPRRRVHSSSARSRTPRRSPRSRRRRRAGSSRGRPDWRGGSRSPGWRASSSASCSATDDVAVASRVDARSRAGGGPGFVPPRSKSSSPS